MPDAYDFAFETLRGTPYPLRDLTGKPFIVVNTASKCGFTPQYAGLETLWRRYRERGLTVVGVPCNDFGNQEPGDADEIGAFCETNYGVDFPIMGKVHVKGPEAHPFFTWAAGQGGVLAKPRWNFFKYLVNKNGKLSDWFASLTTPGSDKFTAAVERMLDE